MSGVSTVARLELRQRLRAGRWQVLLGLWLLALALVTFGARQSVRLEPERGAVMYGVLSLFLLVLGLLVVPALSSQSVNGDRERGVLALLQVTDLAPWEIALGKAVAAWGMALVFLAVSLPLALWCLAEGGVGVVRLVVVTAVQGLLLGVVVAVSLALSALLARTTTSAVLSYLTVVALTIGTVVAFGLAVGATATQVQQTSDDGSGGTYTYVQNMTRTDRVWPLLAPNPVVIMIDASPAPAAQQLGFNDPLRALRESVRGLRRPPPSRGEGSFSSVSPADGPAPIWPWGLAADLLLAAGALAITVRRLRTPSRTLPRGVRVA